MEMDLNKLFGIFEKKERKLKNRIFEAYGIRSMHQDYLRIISDEPGISQDGIARKVYTDKANVARQIACLEKQDLLLRKTSEEDARFFKIYLTEKGKKIHKQTEKDLIVFNRKLINGINEEDIRTFNEILNRMIKNIEDMEEQINGI